MIKKVKSSNLIKKEFRTAFFLFLLCRNSNVQITSICLMTTILLKSHKITNGGLELLNVFSRFCVSSTLFYTTMHSYSEQKETEFWESLNNDSFTPHFDVDNFAIKKHNLRDHTESMTRICTLLAVGKVDVSDLLRLWGNTDFNFSFEYFSLTSVDELSFLNECNNNVSKFDTLKKKKSTKKKSSWF